MSAGRSEQMKIISLVPSITELLFDLGLEKQLIGRTKFCVHPDKKVYKIPQFGGTKKLHLDRIISAQPTLIIANKEENLKEEVEELQKHFDVMVTDVSTISQNNKMILAIGERTYKKKEALALVNEINSEFAQLSELSTFGSVLYLIWNNPMMSVGGDTFIHEMLFRAGFKNICANQTRYPIIDPSTQLKPSFVFLSSEPFPFKEKHKQSLKEHFPQSKFVFVDGEMFSWYGSRIRLAPKYFLSLRKQLVYLSN